MLHRLIGDDIVNNVTASQVFYGSRGMIWIDGNKIAEIQEIKATLTAEKKEVNIARKMSKSYKIVGFEGKGKFKVLKVTSYFIDKLAPSIRNGQQVLFTIVSEVDDPDAVGNERVALYRCQVDAVDLINWKVKELQDEEYDFTFEDFEMLDSAY